MSNRITTYFPATIRAGIAIVVMGIAGTSCSDQAGEKTGKPSENNASSADQKQRIVSLAPSITEILFALDLGPRVVGNTKFCDYPPAADETKKIGGYHDTNYEAIISLQPDLVILLKEHAEAQKHLSKLGLNVLEVNTQTVDGIIQAITKVGRNCDRSAKAEELVSSLNKRMAAIREKTADRPRPDVLVCIGRNMGSQGLKDVYIAGKDGFYSRLIELAGGTNVYQNEKVKFPKISREGLLSLNPDVILDMAADLKESDNMTKSDVVAEWNKLDDLDAVKNDRVYVLTADYVTVPGPRFIHLLEQMAQSIHPEAEWQK